MKTPDELRALADALDRIARTHAMIAPDESETQHRAADYLRQCADAQPAAWRCEVRGDGCVPKLGAVGWRHYHTTTSEREVLAFVTRCGNGIEGRAVPLYTHPAPAAPQAEPHRNQPLRDLLAVIHCDGGHHTEAVGIEQSIKDALSAVCVLKGKLAQAEPKREPLSNRRIGELWNQAWSIAGITDKFRMIEFARLVERAHGIGGSDD